MITNQLINVPADRTRAWLLTFNESLEVDMSSDRHVSDGPVRKFDSEDQRVVVDFSLGH